MAVEPKLSKYVVFGTNIKDATGKKVGHGGVALLDNALARKYNEANLLRPYIEDAENEPAKKPA